MLTTQPPRPPGAYRPAPTGVKDKRAPGYQISQLRQARARADHGQRRPKGKIERWEYKAGSILLGWKKRMAGG